MENKKMNFAFFGTDEFAVMVLHELENNGYIPSLIITAEDKPVGRKLVITPPPVKIWAEKHGVSFLQPTTIKNAEILADLKSRGPFDLFIVAFYNKIIPQEILDIPEHGCLNIHPSLLPKLRGPSPTKTAILQENETGVSIIVLDAEMDHGSIITQEKTAAWTNNPPYNSELQTQLVQAGATLLVKSIPDWITGKIQGIPQDDTQATYCVKIKKEDGLIDLVDDPEKNLRKIRAFNTWPRAYYMTDHGRVIVTRAHIADGVLILEKVIPEGRKEMSFEDFKRGLK